MNDGKPPHCKHACTVSSCCKDASVTSDPSRALAGDLAISVKDPLHILKLVSTHTKLFSL